MTVSDGRADPRQQRFEFSQQQQQQPPQPPQRSSTFARLSMELLNRPDLASLEDTPKKPPRPPKPLALRGKRGKQLSISSLLSPLSKGEPRQDRDAGPSSSGAGAGGGSPAMLERYLADGPSPGLAREAHYRKGSDSADSAWPPRGKGKALNSSLGMSANEQSHSSDDIIHVIGPLPDVPSRLPGADQPDFLNSLETSSDAGDSGSLSLRWPPSAGARIEGNHRAPPRLSLGLSQPSSASPFVNPARVAATPSQPRPYTAGARPPAATFSSTSASSPVRTHFTGERGARQDQPLPIPPRRKLRPDGAPPQPMTPSSHRMEYGGGGSSSSGSGASSVAAAFGGVSAAVGKIVRGWNAGSSSQASTPDARRTTFPSRIHEDLNAPTRKWLAAADATATSSRAGSGRTQAMLSAEGVFGMPLREAALRTRLGRVGKEDQSRRSSRTASQLVALDLGRDFSLNVPSPTSFGSPRAPSPRPPGVASTREEARMRYLPAIVVRCIESLETMGTREEGIYRLTGRSSHTAKLRSIFDAPTTPHTTNRSSAAQVPDLELSAIGPADLDLNSVSSVLKAYLRDLPESLLTDRLATEFDRTIRREAGVPAVSASNGLGLTPGTPATGPGSGPDAAHDLSKRIAVAARPLVDRLPAANWYLLRELCEHLGDMIRPETVAETKMPLSNLCLVLAPTLGLSVAMLQSLVQHRQSLFRPEGPEPDPEFDGPLAYEGEGQEDERIQPRSASAVSSPWNKSKPLSSPTSLDNSAARQSVYTIRGGTAGGVKRTSAGSVATLREAFEKNSAAADGLGLDSPPSHDWGFAARQRSPRTPGAFVLPPLPLSPVPGALMDELDRNAPIAAKFVRQRRGSSASMAPSLMMDARSHSTSSSLAASDSEHSSGGTGTLQSSRESLSDSLAPPTSTLSRPRPLASGSSPFAAGRAPKSPTTVTPGTVRRLANAASNGV